jgi:aspartyl protease family protein
MAGTIGLAILLVALAILVATHGQDDIAGLSPDAFASLAALSALTLVAASVVVNAFRGRFLDGVRAMLSWVAVGFLLMAAYTYRFEFQEIGARVLGEFNPGRPTVGADGEVFVNRRGDGTFVVTGRIGDTSTRLLFDTGASTVVLTAETASAAGYRIGPTDYSIPVSTANGRTLAAPITIEELTVGPITERRVRALVAKPGVLRDNLLGMTFLERLTSYEVRGSRLILRGRTG